MEIAAKPSENFINKLVLNKWFWLSFCLFFFAYPIYRSINRELPNELPVLFQVPTFVFEDENGIKFGSENLRGKVYIASFFFASCPSTCPKILESVQKIQHRVRGVGQSVQILTFTVDPQHDSKQVLFKQARQYDANPYVWKFLRSDTSATEALLVDGFKVPIGDRVKLSADVYDIVHSEKLVLVDQDGAIRGYYSLDKDSVNRLMIDVGLLINRAKLNFKNNKES
jgi:protein SCO1/2